MLSAFVARKAKKMPIHTGGIFQKTLMNSLPLGKKIAQQILNLKKADKY